MSFSEMSREGLGWFQTALGPGALLVDQAANQLFHRNADLAGIALEPGLVAGIDVADGDACARALASCSVNGPPTGRTAIKSCYR